MNKFGKLRKQERHTAHSDFAFLLLTFLYTRKYVRVNGDEGTPVPIPNTVVKLIYGDNTWLATAREDNSTRTLKSSLKRLLFVLSEKVV